jgi:hypothetical protein
MLHQRELAFLKAMASKASAKKRTTVPAGKRGTIPEGIALHRTTGKRKGNELDSSDDTSEPTTRRPALGPRHCPPTHREPQANKPPLAAGISCASRVGRNTRR